MNTKNNNTGKVKRIALSLDEEQIALLRSVKGFGSKDAEIVRNILLAYLSEKGYVDKFNEQREKK